LPVWWSFAAFVVFSALLYGVTLLKSRIVGNWKAKRLAPQPA
jgi:hypothetical protein